MLAIRHDPLLRNKVFLSTVAVAIGFLLTVGIIQTLGSHHQSVQQSSSISERRASLISPIKASSSETSSESGGSSLSSSQN